MRERSTVLPRCVDTDRERQEVVEVGSDRVARTRQAVTQGGRYHVSAKALAERLIQTMLAGTDGPIDRKTGQQFAPAQRKTYE